jgi:hypothetical protein
MFVRGSIAEAMQKSEQLAWPLLLFVATSEESTTVNNVIRDAQLTSVALMQLVVVGSTEHTQLQALVANTETPRVHIFAPRRCRATLPPMSLSGDHFTAEKLGEAVDLASEWSETYVQELTQRLGKETELVQKEATRFRKAQDYEKAKNLKPLFGKEATVTAASTNVASNVPEVSSKALPPTPTAGVQSPNAKQHAESDNSLVICDGDVCRRVPASKPKDASESAKASASTPSVAVAPTAPEAPKDIIATISVRCQLPDGKHFLVETLLPEGPLEDVRKVVEERLQHSEFSIYNSYPPKRFTDDDMAKSLKSLGLDRNAAVRIVMNASLTDNHRPTSAPTTTSSSGGPGIIPVAAGRLAGLIRGVAGAFVGGGAPQQQGAPQQAEERPASQQQQRPQGASASRPRFATLSSLAQAENEEKEDDNPRKQNRYFGGTSTEYEGK